jgi:hypothetical protein
MGDEGRSLFDLVEVGNAIGLLGLEDRRSQFGLSRNHLFIDYSSIFRQFSNVR